MHNHTKMKCPRCHADLKIEDVDETGAYWVCTDSSCYYTRRRTEEPLGVWTKYENTEPNVTNKHEPIDDMFDSLDPQEPDPIRPSHYTNSTIECINALQAFLTPEEFKGFLRGNIVKYLWRANLKNSPSEDSQKAQWYLNKLVEVYKNERK